jgi:hypothetical protein
LEFVYIGDFVFLQPACDSKGYKRLHLLFGNTAELSKFTADGFLAEVTALVASAPNILFDCDFVLRQKIPP